MKILKLLFTVVVISFLFSSCLYDFIAPEQAPDIPDDQTVSFKNDVLPIFATDNCTSCHKAGGTAPDLTGSDVHSAIVPAFVNTTTPENSAIYDYPAPATSKHAWKKYSASQAAYVLKWIQQGAQDN